MELAVTATVHRTRTHAYALTDASHANALPAPAAIPDKAALVPGVLALVWTA